MTLTRSAGIVALWLLASLAFAQPGVAQDRETLWTKATAEGRVISLAWDKQHPWDAVLTAAGAELVAKYQVEGRREVSESLGRATIRPGDSRTVRFALPDTVRANPIGPVCLFVQLPDRRVLPIRRANAKLADTVGFRYDAWDRQMRRRTQARAAEQTLVAAQRALAVSTQSVANQEASVKSRGWSTLDACTTIAAPANLASAKPFDAVAPPEQDEAARRVCVRQVWLANDLITNYVQNILPERFANDGNSRDVEVARSRMTATFSAAFVGTGGDVAELLKAIVDRLGGENPTVNARMEQLREFIRDWSRFAETSEDYRPQFGKADTYLSWPSTAGEVAFRIFGPALAKAFNVTWAMEGVPAATTRDLESFLGASLDAYAGCLEDGRKQLSTKWDNWQAEQSRAPQFATSARDFLVRECRQEVGLIDKLKAERVAIEAQLAKAKQAMTVASTPPALASKPEVLNQISCSQP
jgi:hypothetical protein